MDSFEFDIKSNVVKSNTQSYFEKHYHNSTFHNFPHNNGNGILGATTTTTTTTPSLSSLIHQQPLSSHHINSSTIITSTMPPPLIHYNQQSQQSSTSSSFYTAHTPQHAPSNSNNKLGGDHHQQMKNSETESAVISKVNDENSSAEVNATAGEQLDNAMTEEACDTAAEVSEETDEPEIDIVISNVVCAFNVRSSLQLKEIALHGINVEYKRENGMVTMKLRKPYTTASIWSSGKITCTGATSEDQARVAARRYARILQKLNFRVRFQNYRVVNVLGTCKMPFAIKIVQFSEKYKKEASYEPELHPGVTYNLKDPKATLKIFSTGSMTVTAGSVAYVQAAIEHIYPLVYEFKKPRIEKDQRVEEVVNAIVVESDIEDDEDDDDDEDDEALDPLAMENREPSPPPNKKQKLRDISHLQKRYKGPPPPQVPQKNKRRGGAKRPLGKMNDPKEDLIYVSDGDDF